MMRAGRHAWGAHLHEALAGLVGLRVGLRVLDHLLDLVLAEAAAALISICFCSPVCLSLAVTFMMPLASMSKLTCTKPPLP